MAFSKLSSNSLDCQTNQRIRATTTRTNRGCANMKKDEIIEQLRDMAKYPTVTLPRDYEILMTAADLLAQQSNEQVEPVVFELYHHIVLKLAEAGCKLSEQQKMVLCNLKAVTNPPVPTAQPKEPEQEPYGYLKLNTGKFVNEVDGLNPMKDKRYLPLYTTPPQRKPLTDEDKQHAFIKWGLIPANKSWDIQDWFYAGVAFAEAAHGIKENT